MVEAVEQLQVTPDIKKVSLAAMQVASDKLKQEYNLQRCHSLIFVGSKLLTLYSTKSAQMLSSADIFFLNVFCQCLQLPERKSETHLLFLQGCAGNNNSGCIPYSASVVAQENDMYCLFLIEYGHLTLSNGLYDTFFALHKINNVQMQSDLENLRPAYESLDTSTKQTLDALKKIKFGSNEIEEAVRTFQSKWDILKRKYLDFFKTWDREVVVKIESNMPNFVDAVKELFRVSLFFNNH
jgi:Hermansky-Pudlak syndrome 1 protein